MLRVEGRQHVANSTVFFSYIPLNNHPMVPLLERCDIVAPPKQPMIYSEILS